MEIRRKKRTNSMESVCFSLQKKIRKKNTESLESEKQTDLTNRRVEIRWDFQKVRVKKLQSINRKMNGKTRKL